MHQSAAWQLGEEWTEVKGSHAIYVSRPDAVASIIDHAAVGVSASK
jgi:hypothetical protein